MNSALAKKYPTVARLARQNVDADPTTYALTREAVQMFKELQRATGEQVPVALQPKQFNYHLKDRAS